MPWSGLNDPTQSGSATQPIVTVKQTASKAIAYWSSFNVGPNTTLYFDQSGGNDGSGNGWIVLNRVTDQNAFTGGYCPAAKVSV